MKKINPDKIKNILVVRNDRFGEFILNLPALKALRDHFKNAKITAVVLPQVKELIEDSPFVDVIIVDNFSKNLKLFGILKIASQLRKQRFDLAIMLNPSKIFNILSFLAMVPIRVGYSRKSGFLLTHRLADKKYEGAKHEVEYNLELASLVGANIKDTEISLPVKVEDVKLVNKLLDGKVKPDDILIAVHPWTSDRKKQWPLSNFILLINNLIAQGGLKIVLIGGKENKDSISDEHFLRKDAVINLVGVLNLRQTQALLTKCACLVSCDSGPVHLAAASGVKTVVLFRKKPAGVSAKRWGPWGDGHVIIEDDNLSDITVEQVLGKIKGLL